MESRSVREMKRIDGGNALPSPPVPSPGMGASDKIGSENPVAQTVLLNKATMKSLRNIAVQMAKKTQLHFLLGIQYLRFGHSTYAQEHLKTALETYAPAQCCDQKWQRLVETKMKLAYAQSLYDFASTSRAAAPGTGRGKPPTSARPSQPAPPLAENGPMETQESDDVAAMSAIEPSTAAQSGSSGTTGAGKDDSVSVPVVAMGSTSENESSGAAHMQATATGTATAAGEGGRIAVSVSGSIEAQGEGGEEKLELVDNAPSLGLGMESPREIPAMVVQKAIEEAKHKLTNLVKEQSTRVECWNHLGRLLFDEGQPAIARMVYEQLINSFPGSDDLVNNLGFLRILSNAPEKAISNFRDIVTRCPTHLDALNNYAAVLIYKGKYAEAQTLLRQGLNCNKSVPQMWNALAISYIMEGKDEHATECFQKARKNEKYHTGAAWSIRFTMANYLRRIAAQQPSLERKQNCLQGAENLLESVLRFEETSDVHVALAKLHLARALLKQASQPAKSGANEHSSSDKSKEAGKADADETTTTGQTTDHIQKAEDHLVDAVQMDRDNRHAWNELGLAYLRQGKYENAIKYLLTAVSLDSKQSALWINLSVAYILAGRHGEAEKVLDKAIQLDRNNVEAMNNLANLYKSKGDLDAAKKIYVKCIDVLKDRLRHQVEGSKQWQQTNSLVAQAQNNMALVHIRQGKLDLAMDNLQVARQCAPDLACVAQNIARLEKLQKRGTNPVAAQQALQAGEGSAAEAPSLQQQSEAMSEVVRQPMAAIPDSILPAFDSGAASGPQAMEEDAVGFGILDNDGAGAQ